MKEYPVCSTCGSEEIKRDAWAGWNIDTQMWEYIDVLDQSYCEKCEGECDLDWKEI